jgi:hypothetical protein
VHEFFPANYLCTYHQFSTSIPHHHDTLNKDMLMVFHTYPVQLPHYKHNVLTAFHAYLVSLPHFNHELRTNFSCLTRSTVLSKCHMTNTETYWFFMPILFHCHISNITFVLFFLVNPVQMPYHKHDILAMHCNPSF